MRESTDRRPADVAGLFQVTRNLASISASLDRARMRGCSITLARELRRHRGRKCQRQCCHHQTYHDRPHLLSLSAHCREAIGARRMVSPIIDESVPLAGLAMATGRPLGVLR